MARLAAIYRHPVKSLGEEAPDRVALVAGQVSARGQTLAVAPGEAVKIEVKP